MSGTERINAPRIRYIVSRVGGNTHDARCVVTQDVLPYTIVAGSPARKIKDR